MPAELVPPSEEGLGDAHTAALALVLESGRLAESSTALFVSAGAGITVAAALYRA
jgi:3-oxoacyl-[acyl-carrier-protein] synthase III